jgi:regulatory protein YycH of two-component signal transduction system YycFG
MVMAFSLAVSSSLPSDFVRVSRRQFYFAQEILPDHVLYPFVMGADKLRMYQSPADKQLFVKVSYSFKRLDYAQKLLEKNKPDLAETAATKSQKYLNLAAYQSLQEPTDRATKQYVYQAFLTHTQRLKDLGIESRAVSDLHQEGQALAEQLRDVLKR